MLSAASKEAAIKTEVCHVKFQVEVKTHPSYERVFFRALKVLIALKNVCNNPVQQPLPAGAHWCGQHYASCVDSLVEALLVDPSGELSDQNWSHPLEA